MWDKIKKALRRALSNKKRLVVFGILVALTAVLAESSTKELMKPELVDYTQFLEELNAGKVDVVYYDQENNEMEYALYNEKTRGMSLKDRQKYSYKPTDKRRTYYPAGLSFREQVLEKGARLEVVSFDLVSVTLIIKGVSVGFMLVLVILLYKMVKGTGSGKVATCETSDIRFSDVIGQDEVIKDLQVVVSLLQSSENRAKLGASVPRGILFNGEPGTGKTLIAKALAGEGKVPFFYANASSFIELYVGTGAKRVRDLFKAARQAAPCIVFIDEIDAIGSKRGKVGSNSEDLQTINALLQEMDGFNTTQGVFVIGATNNADDLDPALLRSGRFDRQVNIMPPRDWKVREELFNHFLRGTEIEEGTSIEVLARETSGFTGADIQAIVNEAKIIGVQKSLKRLNMDCLEEAIDKKIFKGNRKAHDKENKDRELIAYHESGHAVMSYLLGQSIARVTIVGTTTGVGGAVIQQENVTGIMTETELKTNVIIAYAGRVSELIKFGQASSGASNDITQATKYINLYVDRLGFDTDLGMLDLNSLGNASSLIGKETLARKSKLAKELEADCRALLTKAYPAVEVLAQRLLKCETLSGDEFLELMGTVFPDTFNPPVKSDFDIPELGGGIE